MDGVGGCRCVEATALLLRHGKAAKQKTEERRGKDCSP